MDEYNDFFGGEEEATGENPPGIS